MYFFLLIFLQINLYSFSPSDTIWDKTLKYINEGKMKVFEGRNFFIFDESNYTKLDINGSKMEALYQKQKELHINYGIPNYIFAVNNHNEDSESLTQATHNLAAHLNNEFKVDKNRAVIAYLSMKTRRIKIRTGETIRKNITDSEAENMINNLKPYLQEEAYYNAWVKFINDIKYYRIYNSNVYRSSKSSSSNGAKTFLIVIIAIGGTIVLLFLCVGICICLNKVNTLFYRYPAPYTENNYNSTNTIDYSDISTFLKNNRNNEKIFIDYCAICLKQFINEPPQTKRTYLCGHIFHNKCLENLKVPGCPICRQRINPEFNQENAKIIWGIQQEQNAKLKNYNFNEIFTPKITEEKNIIAKKDEISINNKRSYSFSNHSYNRPKTPSNDVSNNYSYHNNSDGNYSVSGPSGFSGGSGGSGGASGGW